MIQGIRLPCEIRDQAQREDVVEAGILKGKYRGPDRRNRDIILMRNLEGASIRKLQSEGPPLPIAALICSLFM